MNPYLSRLLPYPFERLALLKEGVQPSGDNTPIAMSMGEPQHAAPDFVADEIIANLHGLSRYPLTRGSDELRQAIAGWVTRRFDLPAGSIAADRHVLPVNGTREALFAFGQCQLDGRDHPLVHMPNPCYQIYEGAALLAGAEPYYLNTTEQTGLLPDFNTVPNDVWERCQLVYICSPGNPTGAVLSNDQLQQLIGFSDAYDFVIAADECYSEIYGDEQNPPPGLLGAAAAIGRHDYRRCIVFHSLSKRSNVPGLRSGFVAGDEQLIQRFLRYRTYHGCAMAPPSQAASIRIWNDEQHVQKNRELYRQKFAAVLDILKPVLNVEAPQGGFYLWPKTPVDDTEFARGLYEQFNVTVLPGSFLSRDAHGVNPGRNHVRMALVPPLEECIEAAERIRQYVARL